MLGSGAVTGIFNIILKLRLYKLNALSLLSAVTANSNMVYLERDAERLFLHIAHMVAVYIVFKDNLNNW